MTPKEKAAKLVQMFTEIMPCLENQTGHLILQHAKQCAIICVDEIIQTMEPGHISPVNYWQKVKTEIEKL